MSRQTLLEFISENKWYENEDELKYYGSALNKFIDLNCTHEMTAINIDLIIQKISHKRLRIIESKNKKEPMKKGQNNLFCKFLPKIFEFLNNQKLFGYLFEIFLITGTWPYDEITKIHNLITQQIKFVNRNELIKFFNIELEFEDI